MGDNDHTEVGTPFEKATNLRSFKLIVEGKTLFVNAHFLADYSPFFEALCLGKFAEGLKGEAELKDAKYDDVIEMLKVLGADTKNVRKGIDINNCVTKLSVADKWQIESVQKECVLFLETKLPTVRTSLSTTMKLLMACEKFRVPNAALYKVASRLAAFGRTFLFDQEVYLSIENKALAGAIIAAADTEELRPGHRDSGYGESMCSEPGCPIKTRACDYCRKAVCSTHYICLVRLEATTATNKNLNNIYLNAWKSPKLY